MISSLRYKFRQCGLEFVHNVRNFFFSGFKFKACNDTKSKQKRSKWKLSLVNYYVEINTVTKPFHSLFCITVMHFYSNSFIQNPLLSLLFACLDLVAMYMYMCIGDVHLHVLAQWRSIVFI